MKSYQPRVNESASATLGHRARTVPLPLSHPMGEGPGVRAILRFLHCPGSRQIREIGGFKTLAKSEHPCSNSSMQAEEATMPAAELMEMMYSLSNISLSHAITFYA